MEYKEDCENVTPHQCLFSPFITLLQPWVSKPPALTFIALVVTVSFYQCWPYRDFCWLAWTALYFKTDEVEVIRVSWKWALIVKKTSLDLKSWDLKGLHLLMKTVNNEEFEYFQLKASLFFHDSFKKKWDIVSAAILTLLCR